MKKIMLVFNPKAGKAKFSKELEALILKRVQEDFDFLDIRRTEKAKDAISFSTYACQNFYDSLLVYGGDGTINEVLQGFLGESHIPKLQLLPGGTGNILTQIFQIDQNKRRAVGNMDFSRVQMMDVGIVGDQVFSVFFSIGPIPEAVHSVSPDEKRQFGPLAYFKESLNKMSKRKQYNLRVETENDIYEGLVDHLFISLTNSIGYLQYSQQNKALDNGYANIYLVKDALALKTFSLFGNVLMGRAEEDDHVEYMSAKNIRIESLEDDPIETDLDGDYGPPLPVDIEIRKAFLPIYLPLNYRATDKRDEKE